MRRRIRLHRRHVRLETPHLLGRGCKLSGGVRCRRRRRRRRLLLLLLLLLCLRQLCLELRHLRLQKVGLKIGDLLVAQAVDVAAQTAGEGLRLQPLEARIGWQA